MKKYYVGLVVLLGLSICLVGYTLSRAGRAKADSQTTKTVNEAGSKLDLYISNNNLIPDSLGAVGVKNVPSTITYTKIGNTQYKFCANYNTASAAFDAGWTALLGGAASSVYPNIPSNTTNNIALDTYLIIYQHKKGQNCQTITPTITIPDSTGNSFSGGSTILQ